MVPFLPQASPLALLMGQHVTWPLSVECLSSPSALCQLVIVANVKGQLKPFPTPHTWLAHYGQVALTFLETAGVANWTELSTEVGRVGTPCNFLPYVTKQVLRKSCPCSHFHHSSLRLTLCSAPSWASTLSIVFGLEWLKDFKNKSSDQ